MSEKSIEEIYEIYGEMLYKISLVMLKNTHDAEDVVQNVMIKYMTKRTAFNSSEHEKAWLIRVCLNCCKDTLRFLKRSSHENIDDIKTTYPRESETAQVLVGLMNLPNRYRKVLILYYYEGYKCNEIAKILIKPCSTIRVYLHKGRKLLKNMLGGDFDEE